MSTDDKPARRATAKAATFVARELQRRASRPAPAIDRSAPPRSHRDREIARRGHLVHKFKAKDASGRWAYYVVLIEPRKDRSFQAALKHDGSIDLAAFGQILASNFGEEPSAETRAEMKRRFGFDI